MDLLDSNITNYVIKPSKGIFSVSLEIEDENGKKLGKLKGGFTSYSKISLYDLDNTVVLTIKQKVSWKSLYEHFEIKNASGTFIGKVKRERGLRGRDIFMEGVNGKEVFRTKIPHTEDSYEIYDDKGESIAEISKKSIFIGSLTGETGPWSLKVLNQSISRVSLLGFFITVFLNRPSTNYLSPQ